MPFDVARFGRITVNASPSEIAVLQFGYNLAPLSTQVALDARIAAISDTNIVSLLVLWRQGSPFGWLAPFGEIAAVLTGNPADDVDAISAGTGAKIPVTGGSSIDGGASA